MLDLLPLALVLVVAVVTIAVVGRSRQGPSTPAGAGAPGTRRGPIDVIWGVIDASVAMFLIRRFLGRPTGRIDDSAPDATASIDADTLAHRIGVPGAPLPPSPSRILVAAPVTMAAPTPPVVTPAGRGNRWRDGAVAFVALAVVLVGAATLWPRASVAVDRSSPAPAGSVAVVAQATPAPTATPTAAPTRTPKPTAAPTAVPTAA